MPCLKERTAFRPPRGGGSSSLYIDNMPPTLRHITTIMNTTTITTKVMTTTATITKVMRTETTTTITTPTVIMTTRMWALTLP